jgi:hypothetical protein
MLRLFCCPLLDFLRLYVLADHLRVQTHCVHTAEASTTIRDTAENFNSVSGWQSHDAILASSGITRTGAAGNRLYTIDDASDFRNAGRYGDTIGGFTFSGSQPDLTPPIAPGGLAVR